MIVDTFLQVPYSEKEDAKQLGARWNRDQRLWYVPAGHDLAPFTRWLPADSSLPLALNESPADEQGWSLRELIQRIQQLVQPGFPEPFWVRAELADVKHHVSGTVYLTLVERNADMEIARLDAMISSTLASTLLTRFEQQTGGRLTSGLRILAQVEQVTMRLCYGLQLRISALDPRYTLGEMAIKLQAIRQVLQEEGIANRNRQQTLPRDFFHIAVVSPDGAAGLGDFQAEAERLERYGICQFRYFPAVFQGAAARTGLNAALTQAMVEPGIDALVIIRGGGSAADLHWLNEPELARAVCLSPVPVLTGIGHEKDQTVLDEVACRALGTPSKVIHFIEDTIRDSVRRAREDFAVIAMTARRRVEKAARAVEYSYRDMTQAVRRQCLAADQAVERNRQTVIEESHRCQVQAAAELAQRWSEFHWEAYAVTQRSRNRVEQLTGEIIGLGPERTLQRGFTLVRAAGQLITSCAIAKSHNNLEIEFHDGRLTVQQEPDNNPA